MVLSVFKNKIIEMFTEFIVLKRKRSSSGMKILAVMVAASFFVYGNHSRNIRLCDKKDTADSRNQLLINGLLFLHFK